MKRTKDIVSSAMGPNVSLRFARGAFEALRRHLTQEPSLEQFAFGLVTHARTADGTVLIVQDILLPDAGDLNEQGPAGVDPTRQFQATAYLLAEQRGMSVLDVHTHTHKGVPHFSGIDENRSAANADWIGREFRPPATMAMLVFGNDTVGHDAVVYDRSVGAFRNIDTLEILGRRIEIRRTGEGPSRSGTAAGMYGRQVLIPEWDQSALARQKVAILGLGGNGSHILQTLASIGVGTAGWIAGIDYDLLEESNLPRIPYALPEDVGQPKVTVAARYVGRKNPSVKFYPYPCSVVENAAQSRMKAATVLIGAGDGDGLRKLANEIAVRYQIPFIDLGCDVQTNGREVTAGGQVRVILPGRNACLVCCGGYDPAAAAEDLLDDENKLLRAVRGYGVGGRGEAAPSVANLNATIAQLGMAAFLALVHGGRFGRWDHAYFNLLTAETLVAQSERNPDCPLCGLYGCCGDGDGPPTAVKRAEPASVTLEKEQPA